MATECSEDDETGSGNASLVHSDSDDAAPQSLRQFCEGMSIGHMRVFAVACEQAERWDDMLVAMETLLDAQRLALSGAWCRLCGPRLHACRSSLSAIPQRADEERDLFALAAKQAIAQHRIAWRHMDEMQRRQSLVRAQLLAFDTRLTGL